MAWRSGVLELDASNGDLPQMTPSSSCANSRVHSAPAVSLHCSDSVRKPNHATSSTLPSRPVSSRNYAPSPSTRQDVVRI